MTNKKSQSVLTAFLESEGVIRRYLRRFSSNSHDIDDITQETILRALKAEKAKEITEPRAFLFGIARNVVRKRLDKKARSLIDYIEDFAPAEYVSNMPSVSETYEARERFQIFADAVVTLPPQCQRVFVLKKVYGYSHKEIAKKLGISISTIEKHVATGLKRCSEYMEKYDTELPQPAAVKTLRRI